MLRQKTGGEEGEEAGGRQACYHWLIYRPLMRAECGPVIVVHLPLLIHYPV